jgi:hypothetical protein
VWNSRLSLLAMVANSLLIHMQVIALFGLIWAMCGFTQYAPAGASL